MASMGQDVPEQSYCTNQRRFGRLSQTHALILSSFLLASCGGGGDNGTSSTAPTPTPAPAPPLGDNVPGPRPAFGPRSFVLYESGQVRPLSLSGNGTRLYATNTPDNRLEIFSVGQSGLTQIQSVPVGMEPVAVAEAGDGNIWVVNHLSDSISIIDISQVPARVIRTLWVGDEPRDIIFAGANRSRAFITTAHRGQNSPVDPQLTTAGVGRADIWVFDIAALGNSAGGDALTIVNLFGDRTRGLAVTPDGSKVYAGIFMSGNRTTTIAPPGLPKAPPTTSADGVTQPDTGLIVRFDGINWVDETGTPFSNRVPFSLPDFDVFAIDAESDPPLEEQRFSGIGTILFNLVVNPANSDVYVSNIASRNRIRFAGPGARSNSTVRGHLADHRISIIGSTEIRRRDLNKHLDFSREFGTQAERDASLSMPLDMAVSQDGSTLYVSAFGSAKIGVFDTDELRSDSFVPSRSAQIELTAGGPSGIVLDEPRERGYVLTRFDNGISVIDTTNRTEISHLQFFNPEPAHIVNGRPFLYDARLTSSRGNDSCASCHIFGDNDALAWDLGDPDSTVKDIPNTFLSTSRAARPFEFHPMKGPMTTQSMRGTKGHGPMHWRGDRTGVDRVDRETLEEAAFKEFNEAFDGLMAREQLLNIQEMQVFTDFAMELTYPPNPIRRLDNSLNASETRGLQLYNQGIVRQGTRVLEICAQCHPLDPKNGIFGTKGLMADNSQPGERNMKIPHFRDQYQKVGMFGFGFNSPTATGSQIRGFGFNHNGATSGNFVIEDLNMPVDDLAAIRAFLFAYPTESPPIVGQQVTLDHINQGQVSARMDLLIQQALVTSPVPECDLVVKGVVAGEQRGWLMNESGLFISDRAGEVELTRTDLESLAQTAGQPLTFTCAPWGSGIRMGIDRDLDGVLDADE
jgi:DNA-binding beta-propeller fold protein YncE